MEINCLSCGHRIDLGDAYGDYEGQIKCWICGAILDIKTAEGSIKSAKLVKAASHPSVETPVGA